MTAEFTKANGHTQLDICTVFCYKILMRHLLLLRATDKTNFSFDPASD